MKTTAIDHEEEKSILSAQFLTDVHITLATVKVVVHIAGYISKNLTKKFGIGCSVSS